LNLPFSASATPFADGLAETRVKFKGEKVISPALRSLFFSPDSPSALLLLPDVLILSLSPMALILAYLVSTVGAYPTVHRLLLFQAGAGSMSG
jgi:hypothetical protein